MNEQTKAFLRENQIDTRDQFRRFADGCTTILGFMKEHEMPRDREHLEEVRSLYDGSHPDMDLWVESEGGSKWVEWIQAIEVFPTLDMLLEILALIDNAIEQYLDQYDVSDPPDPLCLM